MCIRDSVQADRAAGVQAVGGDADFSAQAVFEAVREAGRQVDVDRAGIDFALEALGRRQVFGDDRVGVCLLYTSRCV